MCEALEQTREKHGNPVKRGLEEDRPNESSAIVTSQQRHFVRDQHRLTDNERSQCREHEIAQSDHIASDKEIARQHDEVEAQKEKDGRRHGLVHLMQEPRPDATGEAEAAPDWISGRRPADGGKSSLLIRGYS